MNIHDEGPCALTSTSAPSEPVRAWKRLGMIRVRGGRSLEAVPLLCRALAANPSDAECLNALGVALHDLGRLDMALVCYRQAIGIRPDLATLFYNLARALGDLGFREAAIEQYRHALWLRPDDAKALNALGLLLHEQGRWAEALDCYSQAVAIQPDHAAAHSNQGNLLRALGRLNEALEAQIRALSIQPGCAELHANLGTVLQEQGRLDEALAAYRQATEIQPGDPIIESRQLFLQNVAARESPAWLLDLARHFGELARRGAHPFEIWPNAPDPHRPLRIGLVSADFRQHPVGYFLVDVLESLHRLAGQRLLLHGYSAFGIADALTARIHACCHGWSVVTTLSDAALAERIHADGIDILIDLSGHTAHNRLPMFAWRPAPIQVTWLGYFATTGLAEMDYLLADPVGVPPGQQCNFSERIWYLPETRPCFSPPDASPPVSPLPAVRNGYPTFGCFQNPAKLDDRVLRLWARILVALPSARLRLQNQLFDDVSGRDRFAQRLRGHGIDPARVALHGRVPRNHYLATHAEVDLILDTFPFPGGTTTCEALWMGVPTLTLAGESLLARQGASLMTAARLADWVVESEDEYLAKAIEWTTDLSGLSELRGALREQMARSPLCDAERFARHLESAWRGMWRQWLGR